MDELTPQERQQRNADATGHAPDCRRRLPAHMGSDHRALDPERCGRCEYLTAQLDEAAARREARHG